MKKIMTFAAAAAMASPLAIATAAAGDLDIYGRAHLSVDHMDNGDDSSQFITNNSSRLGVRGSEYLGMGLTGLFQYETTVNLGDGGDLFGAGRTSYLGLQGDFGTLLAGRLDDPLKTAMDANQLFGDQLGDAGNFLGYGLGVALDDDGNVELDDDGNVSGGLARGAHQNRHNNVAAYVTPEFQGFSGTFVFQPDQGSNAAIENRYVVEGRYDAQVGEGNLFASLGFLRATENSLGDMFDDQDVIQALVAYRMPGEWRVMGVFQDVSNFGLIEDNDHRVFGGGVGVNVASNTEIKGHVLVFDHREVSDVDSTMFAVGVDHWLTDRTMVYGTWAMTDNDDNIAAQMNAFGHGTSDTYNGEGATPVVGEDQWGLSVGLRHDF